MAAPAAATATMAAPAAATATMAAPAAATAPPPAAAMPRLHKSLRNIESLNPRVFDLYDPAQTVAAHAYANYHGYVVVWPHTSQADATAFGRETVRSIWTTIVNDLALRPDLLARLVSGGFTITDEASLDKFMGPLPRSFFRQLECILGTNTYLHSGTHTRTAL
jgi:hypothetical protein